MALPGIREAPITAAIAIDSSHLPGDLLADPMDRLIIATARHLGMPIVTGDRKILTYAEAGFVRAIPC
jgi:PIN domain nuclease of toxin-antitoxin system